MNLDDRLESRGMLEVVALEDGVLRIDGWVVSLDAGPAETFTVSCAGKG